MLPFMAHLAIAFKQIIGDLRQVYYRTDVVLPTMNSDNLLCIAMKVMLFGVCQGAEVRLLRRLQFFKSSEFEPSMLDFGVGMKLNISQMQLQPVVGVEMFLVYISAEIELLLLPFPSCMSIRLLIIYHGSSCLLSNGLFVEKNTL